MAASLPNFDRPPVAELVLGVQFDPLGMTSGHLGWFWREFLASAWPKAADAPPLPDQIEPFGNPQSFAFPRLRLQENWAAPRLQISNAVGDRLIQIQDTRFIFNWVKRDGGEYPRYPKIRSEFDDHLADFIRFAAVAQFNPPRCNQWEVAYVNHIPAGDLWKTPADWPEVIPGLLLQVRDYGGTKFESMIGDWNSEIPAKRGRLHVSLQFQQSPANILVVALVARGPIDDEHPLEAGLDLGRSTIVRAFTEITSKTAHQYWGRTEDA